MNYEIEEMQKQRIVFIRRTGPYGPSNKIVMEQIKEWAASHGFFKDTATILGIARDNTQTTPPENCRYDACIVIPEEYEIKDENIGDTTLTGGTYAVFTIAHTAEAVQQAWTEIFPTLSKQGHHADFNRPILERYIPSMINRHLCEICVPILL